MTYFHDMADRIHQKHFDAPEISADRFVYICDVTFEMRARHQDTGELPLDQSQTFIKQATPLKNTPTCWSTDIS